MKQRLAQNGKVDIDVVVREVSLQLDQYLNDKEVVETFGMIEVI